MPSNPFHDPLRFEQKAPPCTIVIFGANGDLTRRKLAPALYRLAYDRRIPPAFALVGTSRTKMSGDEFRQKMKAAVQEYSEDGAFDEDVWRGFAPGLAYVAGDINDPKLYQRLGKCIEDMRESRQTSGNVLFYLSTQPSHYEPAVKGIGAAGLAKGAGWKKLVVEKPIGHDLTSARELDRVFHECFPEREIYRIDHYLGKETVQNILGFRFGNGIFEPLWNRRYVTHVQITAAESIGVEGRGAFYQEAGALRDMIQNHLLQIMAVVAMEPPAAFEADAVRDERAKLLRSVKVYTPEEAAAHAVPGQYGPARVGGVDIPGFRQEPGVAADAQTETYAAATFFVDNWRWAGIPFYLRSGKRLARRVTEVAIQFNAAPLELFGLDEREAAYRAGPNLLVLRVQPEEGISLKFSSKQPGRGMRMRGVSMDFNYATSFGARSPSAYETLLLDAMTGHTTLYPRQDMVEASWAIVQPFLDHWAATTFQFPNYPAGSWGPHEADEMLARRGHEWRIP